MVIELWGWGPIAQAYVAHAAPIPGQCCLAESPADSVPLGTGRLGSICEGIKAC